jgi:hypothetical protein
MKWITCCGFGSAALAPVMQAVSRSNAEAEVAFLMVFADGTTVMAYGAATVRKAKGPVD